MTTAINISGIWLRILMAVAPGYAERKELERRFNRIVQRHDNLIMRLCFGYARTASELDDLHQDALVNIWRGLPRFHGDSDMKTWIYRVTLNTCVATLRDRKRRGEEMPIEEIVDMADRSEESVAMLRDLHEGIGRLAPTDRAVVLLWLEELSYDEIAALTGLTRGNVGIRLHRAKEKLKKIL